MSIKAHRTGSETMDCLCNRLRRGEDNPKEYGLPMDDRGDIIRDAGEVSTTRLLLNGTGRGRGVVAMV